MSRSVLRIGLLAAGAALVGATQAGIREPMPSALGDYLARGRVGAPVRYEGLAVFPVTAEGLPRFAPLTMDAARSQKLLEFKELDQPQVSRITVVNRSDEHIFLMAGEVIKGAKQDRVLQDSLLVPPRSTLVNAVFCVEPSRWTGGAAFESAGIVAAPGVRYAAKVPQDQGAVWEAVGETRAMAARMAPGDRFSGSSLLEAQQSSAAQERARGFAAQLAQTPLPEDTRGVVVYFGTEPIAADLFASPELFAALWPKLRDSYLMSALTDRPPKAQATADDARAFLKRALSVRAVPVATPGAGRIFQLKGSVAGTALEFRYQPPVRRPPTGGGMDILVHAELFPQRGEFRADEPDRTAGPRRP